MSHERSDVTRRCISYAISNRISFRIPLKSADRTNFAFSKPKSQLFASLIPIRYIIPNMATHCESFNLSGPECFITACVMSQASFSFLPFFSASIELMAKPQAIGKSERPTKRLGIQANNDILIESRQNKAWILIRKYAIEPSKLRSSERRRTVKVNCYAIVRLKTSPSSLWLHDA